MYVLKYYIVDIVFVKQTAFTLCGLHEGEVEFTLL